MGTGHAEDQPAAEPIMTSVTANGLVADLYGPAGVKGRLPAIIILGGSEVALTNCQQNGRAEDLCLPWGHRR
jgi:hypothetical protein